MSKIMVVDDERDVVDLLSFVLTKDGYQVSTAFNGREALERVGLMPSLQAPERPDLIILDIMMPEIDGFTVQNKLVENEETRSIPIVILTAKGQMRDLFGMASNVVAYIEKPFDPRVLREKIKEIMEKK
ncbi:MAG: response regulator [Endomicrobiales bacterium]